MIPEGNPKVCFQRIYETICQMFRTFMVIFFAKEDRSIEPIRKSGAPFNVHSHGDLATQAPTHENQPVIKDVATVNGLAINGLAHSRQCVQPDTQRG